MQADGGATGRCIECGATFRRSGADNAFMCNDCRDEAGDGGGAHVPLADADAADPVLLQGLQDMGFAEHHARAALERTGNRSLEAAIDYISANIAGLGALPSAAKAPLSAHALGPDGLNAVLLRLVATSGAEQLCRCAGVCRMWYAEAVNEELWQVLLRRRWGEAADEIRESWQPGAAEAAMSSRALYVRSVTTRVLSWGQGARSQEEVGMFVCAQLCTCTCFCVYTRKHNAYICTHMVCVCVCVCVCV